MKRMGRRWAWGTLLGVAIAQATSAPLSAAPGLPEAGGMGLDRRWRELDALLRSLDTLLPPGEADLQTESGRPSVRVPSLPLTGVPLSLPTVTPAPSGARRPLTLEQALGIAFRANPSLKAQREQVAAAVAELGSRLGAYWPRIEAFAGGSSGGRRALLNAPQSNDGLSLGPLFDPGGAFYVPAGGGLDFNQNRVAAEGGLALRYALIDPAREPRVGSARAELEQARQRYATEVRSLQLTVSKAYYGLQRADQEVVIREAMLREDVVILQDSLALKEAGLVPRLDVLRRTAIEARDRQQLIQAQAAQAIARRRLARLLHLPGGQIPVAAEPIRLTSRWPLDLEASVLAAYRGNPELEAILAARQALARRGDATAAALLPTLSLFAEAGASAERLGTFSIAPRDGGCCGSSVVPVLNEAGYDWSVGLAVRWLIFDGGTTRGSVQALERRTRAIGQEAEALRDRIRLRMETAFFDHEASLARLSAARIGVAAALEAFRDSRLRYELGLDDELELSVTQDQLIASLIGRLQATVDVNISYARLLRELLPVPRDPGTPIVPQLRLDPLPGRP